MNNSDRKKFSELMAMMGEVFQKEISKPLLRIYFTALEKIPIGEVEKGISHIITNRTITGTIPLPSEIINAIAGTVEERAEIAWNALLWAIENVGHMRSVKFDDPLIHDTVRALGGWLRVCSADGDDYNEDWLTKNLQWRRKDFISLYRIMAQQSGQSAQYLPGLQEAENKGKFDDFVPPITHVTGKPGQYLTMQTDRPKEIAAPEDDISLLVDNLTKKIGN